MNLVNAEYGIDINLSDEYISELLIENPDSFTMIVSQLCQGCDGKECEWILSENDKVLRLEKTCDFVVNPLQIDLNNKKIQSRLYSEMQEMCNGLISEKNEINYIIACHLEKVINRLPYEYVAYDMEFDWINLFKLVNVRIEADNSTLLESLVEYIRVLSFLCQIKAVVFLNLRSYLDTKSITELQKMAMYYKISILLVESCEREKIPDSKTVIIDKDNCLILK